MRGAKAAGMAVAVVLAVGIGIAAGGTTASAFGWTRRAATLGRARPRHGHPAGAAGNRTPSGTFDSTAASAHAVFRFPREVVLSARPEDFLADSDLPGSWSWQNVTVATGVPPIDFTTRVRNQFLPFWCGSCWAHAAAAVLGSRWHIHAARDRSADFSVQYFVNCVGSCKGCHGGSSYAAIAHAHNYGAVDSSCIPYAAVNQACTATNVCEQNMNSSAPAPIAIMPKKYFPSEYGLTGHGELPMMKEVYARGPVACCMASHDIESFHNYTGGVYSTNNNRTTCDHLITIVGFGSTAAAGNYWLVQNSFGSAWGESGFFRIKRSSALRKGEYNLDIDGGQCSWAMPPSQALP